MELVVQIVRFVSDDPQPGIVACEFADAESRTHTVIDKVYIFHHRLLDERGSYPLPGTVRCEALAAWTDTNGRELVRSRLVALNLPRGDQNSWR